MKKAPAVIAAVLILALIAEFAVCRNKYAYDVVLSSLPKNARQAYLDYVLTSSDGYFRSYPHKANALDVLTAKCRSGHSDFINGRQLVSLLHDGMDGEEEPIPQLSAYVLLLMNSKSNYEALFSRYQNDQPTLDAFRRKVEQLKATDPARYSGIVTSLEASSGFPSDFFGSPRAKKRIE